MTAEYLWPTREDGQRAREAWPVTIVTLAVGQRISGEVIGRQPFGVFVRIDQAPDAIGLMEVITMPVGVALPALGVHVVGEVIGHADHNHQVRLRPA